MRPNHALPPEEFHNLPGEKAGLRFASVLCRRGPLHD